MNTFAKSLVGLAVCLACTAAFAGDVAVDKVFTADAAKAAPRLVEVTNLLTGEVATGSTGVERAHLLVFDNMTLAGSAADLNVSYANAAAYTDPEGSSNAYLCGLGSEPNGVWDAWAGTDGYPNDIIWDDYLVDLSLWPGGTGALNDITRFDMVPIFTNVCGLDHYVTLVTLIVDQSGLTQAGVSLTWHLEPNDGGGWFGTYADLKGYGFEAPIPEVGYVMYDLYRTPSDTCPSEGVGMMFAGGDWLDTTIPDPNSLVTLGNPDSTYWFQADRYTNVDPNALGDPAELLYDEILLSGDLWWITYTDGSTYQIASQFPFRIYVDDGEGWCVADITGASHANGDTYPDGQTNLADLQLLLSAYGSCPGDANYLSVANLVDDPNITTDDCIDLGDLQYLLSDYGCTTP